MSAMLRNVATTLFIAAMVGCDVRTVRSHFDGGRILPIYAAAIKDVWSRAISGESVVTVDIFGES